MADDPLLTRWRETRARTLALAAGLSDADASAQSMPDCSPAKWHLAHTTWFLETFVLPGAARFDPAFDALFNSYYESVGPRIARDRRGLLTRPSLDRVRDYRACVDARVEAAWPNLGPEARTLIELGVAHEEQHQELLLTDMLHLFAQNPLAPAMFARGEAPATTPAARSPSPANGGGRENLPPPPGEVAAKPTEGVRWHAHQGGIVRIGHSGPGFAFDAEGPAHDVFLRPYDLADRLVSNADWDAFIADGGYANPLLWLSDGWAWVKREQIAAPLHWRADGQQFTLQGPAPRDPAAPVTHVSHYEADAYATWAGARLTTEAEWEAAATVCDPARGNQLDGAGPVSPKPQSGDRFAISQRDGYAGEDAAEQNRAAVPGLPLFGDCWQWTQSAFLPHPGFRVAPGAVGEYNGKFMSGQMVLKGASCATPRGHSRASYRNFFPPHARWQFTGLRLARDAS